MAARAGSEQEAIRKLGLHTRQAGIPAPTVRAWLVRADRADARFAASIVLERRGGRLRRADATTSRHFIVWVAYGTLVTGDGALGIGSLTLGPALRPRATSETFGLASLYRLEPDPALAVTAAVLRFVSAEQIRTEAVAYLQATHSHLRVARAWGKAPEPSAHERAAWKKLRETRRPGGRTPDAELEAIARRYLALIGEGDPRPLLTIAGAFGLTREQARDRVHRCRELGFLTKGRGGKATAEAGPRLRSEAGTAGRKGKRSSRDRASTRGDT